MDEQIANDALEIGLEWGPNRLRSIQERLGEKYPALTLPELDFYTSLCKEVESFGYQQFPKSWKAAESNEPLAHQLFKAAVSAKYPWVSKDNASTLDSRGIYYAWKDGML